MSVAIKTNHNENITDEEIDSPELFFLQVPHFWALEKGPGKKKTHISSISSDVVYLVVRGRLRPAKHMEFGLVVKTITGSREVLKILN